MIDPIISYRQKAIIRALLLLLGDGCGHNKYKNDCEVCKVIRMLNEAYDITNPMVDKDSIKP